MLGRKLLTISRAKFSFAILSYAVIVKIYNGCCRVDFCQGSRRSNIYYYPRPHQPLPTLARQLFAMLIYQHRTNPLCPHPQPACSHPFNNHQSSRSKFFENLQYSVFGFTQIANFTQSGCFVYPAT